MRWFMEIAGRGYFEVSADRYAVASKLTMKELRRAMYIHDLAEHKNATKAELIAIVCDTGAVQSVIELRKLGVAFPMKKAV